MQKTTYRTKYFTIYKDKGLFSCYQPDFILSHLPNRPLQYCQLVSVHVTREILPADEGMLLYGEIITEVTSYHLSITILLRSKWVLLLNWGRGDNMVKRNGTQVTGNLYNILLH